MGHTDDVLDVVVVPGTVLVLEPSLEVDVGRVVAPVVLEEDAPVVVVLVGRVRSGLVVVPWGTHWQYSQPSRPTKTILTASGLQLQFRRFSEHPCDVLVPVVDTTTEEVVCSSDLVVIGVVVSKGSALVLHEHMVQPFSVHQYA